MEERIFFLSSGLTLEGLIEWLSPEKALVVTHPHPLYGGDMENPVVEAIVRAYQEAGYTTLRFNFRGVGESAGRYADGVGEREDVRGAVTYLTQRGIKKVELSGYSFGTYVNIQAYQEGLSVASMTMVSPPVAFMDFHKSFFIPCLKWVVTGSRDEIAPPQSVVSYTSFWQPAARCEVIAGADHFYTGYIRELKETLARLIKDFP